MSASQILRAQLDRAHTERVQPLLLSFPWSNREAYGAWLSQTYHYVCHTVPLLRVAIAACTDQHAWLRRALETNASSEQGHELLLLSDLHEIGVALHDEHPYAHRFHAALYDAIAARGPFALLGRLLLLEGMSKYAGPANARAATAAHGGLATSFLREHVHLDGGGPELDGHFDKMMRAMNQLDHLGVAIVTHELWQSVSLYEALVREVAWPHPI